MVHKYFLEKAALRSHPPFPLWHVLLTYLIDQNRTETRLILCGRGRLQEFLESKWASGPSLATRAQFNLQI